MKTNPIEKRLTRQDVAAHLGCSVSSVIRYEKRKLLRSHRAGPRLIRFWVADVIAFENATSGSYSTKPPFSKSPTAKPKKLLAKKVHNPPGRISELVADATPNPGLGCSMVAPVDKPDCQPCLPPIPTIFL
jgi:hypothetical protein